MWSVNLAAGGWRPAVEAVAIDHSAAGAIVLWFATRGMSRAESSSTYQAIERLLTTYAELVDDGEFA